MKDLKEVAMLILLQVQHNKECGKDDKFTIDEIADIINRRVVKLIIPNKLPIGTKVYYRGKTMKITNNHEIYDGKPAYRCDYTPDELYLIDDFESIDYNITNLKRNDFVKYIGGSDSIHLTIGKNYRLTCSPYRDRIAVIDDTGKRMNTKSRYFEALDLVIS